MSLDIDATRLMERVKAYDRRCPSARLEAARDVMSPAMREIVHLTPVDTGRLKRGYALAANAAGLGPVLVPALQPSKRRDYAEIVLTRQAEWFEGQALALAAIAAGGKKGGGTYQGKRISAATAGRRLETAQKRARRAREELAKLHDLAVVIGLFERSGGKTGNRVATTVREKIYGGTGRVIQTEFFSGFQIHNLEGHATIVDRNTGVVKKVLLGAKAFRIKRVGKKYVTTITQGATRAAG